MKYMYSYLTGQVLLIVICLILNILIHYKRITHRTARLLMTGLNLLQGIPLVLALGWPFAFFITILQTSMYYYIFWGTEQMDIELAKKKQREENTASGS